MKNLIIAATELEMKAIQDCDFGNSVIRVVTGMGSTNTAVAVLSAAAAHRIGRIVQLGVAGSYDRTLSVGRAVVVASDFQGDVGAWRAESGFQPFTSASPTIVCSHIQPHWSIPSVHGMSVNCACMPGLSTIASQRGAQIESMEGAAFFQAATALNIPFLQLRTISNYVDDPRHEWQLEEAVAKLPSMQEVIRDFFLP